MKYTPHYSLTLSGGEEIHLLFNSWMYKRYSEKTDTTLEGLFTKINDMAQGGKGFGMGDIPEVLLTASEAYHKFNGLPFQSTDIEAYGWIDDLGGYIKGMSVFTDVVQMFVSKLINIDPDQLETKVEKVEKKSLAIA